MASRLGMRLKVDKSGKIVPPKRPRDQLIEVEGLLVHRGTARADADWKSVIDDVRSERIASVSRR
jgi:hypothetical protein